MFRYFADNFICQLRYLIEFKGIKTISAFFEVLLSDEQTYIPIMSSSFYWVKQKYYNIVEFCKNAFSLSHIFSKEDLGILIESN